MEKCIKPRFASKVVWFELLHAS